MNFTIKHLERAKENIIAEKTQQEYAIRERVNRELQPKFVEVETLKNETLNQLVIDYNKNKTILEEQYKAQLIALQSKLDADKKTVIDNSENKKAEMLNSAIFVEVDKLEKDCASIILTIDNEIAKMKKE